MLLGVVFAGSLARAADDSQRAIKFTEQLFARALKIIAIGNEAIILNGSPGQEGFCKLSDEAVYMSGLIPFVAGKEIYNAAPAATKKAFQKEAYTTLAKFISLGFVNFDAEVTPTFQAKQTDENYISVNVKVPGDNTEMIIKVIKLKSATNPGGELRLFDIITGGVSFMKLKASEFKSVMSRVDTNKLEHLVQVLHDKNATSSPKGQCEI
jgi:ABC-type transporter MlaC component